MKTRNGSEAISTASLLAHVVAHEIGHLLLGPNMHSSLGIMRPRWKSGDFREMEIGQMVFPPDQAKILQTQLRERAGSPTE